MKREAMIAVLAIVLGGVLTREIFPKHEPVTVPVPQIVTVHDTVKTIVRLTGPRVVTSDTVRLIVQETLHDTVQINMAADTSLRPNLWPVAWMTVGASRGDTSLVTTVSLRSGKVSTSRIWTPGPLKGIWMDSTRTPRLDFWPPPERQKMGWLPKIKWGLIGYGACKLTEATR